MVEWRGADAPVDRVAVTVVEEAWGVRFPEDYVQCVLLNGGGSPDPCCFAVGEAEEVFDTLLNFQGPHPWKAVSENRIVDYYATMTRQGLLPERVYPFAYDPGGNYLSFDYRTPAQEPSVVFLAHEELDADGHFRAYPVCTSFTHLLDSLHDCEDEEDEDED